MTLVSALERLVDALERRGSLIRRELQPPLTAPALDRLLGEHSSGEVRSRVHGDVVALYEWHDGAMERFVVDPDRPDLFHYYVLPPAEAAVSACANLLEPLWFPVLYGQAGDWVVVSNDPADPGSVWEARSHDVPHRIFDGLAEAGAAAVWAVEAGEWSLDGRGRLL